MGSWLGESLEWQGLGRLLLLLRQAGKLPARSGLDGAGGLRRADREPLAAACDAPRRRHLRECAEPLHPAVLDPDGAAAHERSDLLLCVQDEAHAGEQLCAQPGEHGGEVRRGEGGQAAIDEQRIRPERERDGERKQRALLGRIALDGNGEAPPERGGRRSIGHQLPRLCSVKPVQTREQPRIAAPGEKWQQRRPAVRTDDLPANLRRAGGTGGLARDQAKQCVCIPEHGERRAARELQRHIGQHHPPRLMRAPVDARKEQRQHALIGAFEIAIGDVCMNEPDHTGIFCMRAPFYERQSSPPDGASPNREPMLPTC